MFCVKDSQRSVDTAIIGRFRKYETAVTAKRADLKMELTNGRAVNREPEIAFNHFRALSHSLLSLRRLRPAYSNYYSFFTSLKAHEVRQVLSKTGADPGFFLGGGALVSCFTSTPINHIAEYQLY